MTGHQGPYQVGAWWDVLESVLKGAGKGLLDYSAPQKDQKGGGNAYGPEASKVVDTVKKAMAHVADKERAKATNNLVVWGVVIWLLLS